MGLALVLAGCGSEDSPPPADTRKLDDVALNMLWCETLASIREDARAAAHHREQLMRELTAAFCPAGIVAYIACQGASRMRPTPVACEPPESIPSPEIIQTCTTQVLDHLNHVIKPRFEAEVLDAKHRWRELPEEYEARCAGLQPYTG